MAEAAKKMTEDQLGSLFDNEFATAQGVPGGDISSDRALLLDYYFSRLFGDETEGSSKIVTSDVADIVDGLMPSLLRIFTTADNLVSFDPVDAIDTAQAEQESDYVNYIFFKQNPAFLILFVWFMDALIQKNGIVKAYADETEEITQETYRGLTREDLAKLMDDKELEAVESDERVLDVPGPDNVTLIPQTVYDITFRRVKRYAYIRVANVAPENYRISSDATSLDPSSARFVGEERDVPRSELVEMGFDKKKVYELPAVGNDTTSSAEKAARNANSDDQQNAGGTTGAGSDKSQEKVRVRAGFLKVDYDGDGRSELRYILRAGTENFVNDVADRQHFHVISPQPLPHKHFGRASAEKGVDVQRVKSELVRQIHDNLYRTNRPSHGVWEQGIGENTIDDLLTDRVGSLKRFARPVSESYQAITVPFTAGATFPMLDYWDKAKRDRSGVSADSQGLSPEALKNIQIGVMSEAMDIGRMKIEMVARCFAETGIKSLMLHIHELAQKHQNKKCVVQLRNRWVPIDPSAWRSRKDMTVNIGLGIGTRAQNLMHLEAIWGKQMALYEKGGANTLVTAQNLFNTAAEFVKNANLKNPTLYFTPSDKLNAPSDEQQALQAQQQALQARQQQLDAERGQMNAAKIQLQAREQMLEMRTKMAQLQLDAADEKRKTDKDRMDARIELEKLKNQLTEMELKYGRDVPGSKV